MSETNVKLKIDGVEVTVPDGTMILKAAKDIGDMSCVQQVGPGPLQPGDDLSTFYPVQDDRYS